MALADHPGSLTYTADLLFACENGPWSDVEHLLGKGATLDCWDVYVQNPLHHACLGNNYIVAWAILVMQELDFTHLLYQKTLGDETPLHMACRLGHVELVNLFINKGALNYRDVNTKLETPLHIACSYGHGNVVKQLLLHRTNDINAKDIYEAVPMFRAIDRGDTDIVCTLLFNHVDTTIKNKYGNDLFHVAILKEQWEIMEMMLFLCPQSIVDDPNTSGCTPLHLAVVTASDETPVETLLTHKADPNIADYHGCTPLHNANERGQFNMVKALLAAGAEVDRVNEFQRTPLSIVSHKGHTELVQLLLEHGAKVHVDNALDPVLEAKETGHGNIADLLTKHLQKKCSPKGVWSMLLNMLLSPEDAPCV